jgi:hypothetical protein
VEKKQRNGMGDFIQGVEERDATAEKVPDIYDKLETLLRYQLTDEGKSVSDVLEAFGTLVVSVGMDAKDITATILGSPRPRRVATLLEFTKFDNDTLFQAASVSKAITALAVIKLCQEGKLDVDTPISQYLDQK